LHPNFVRDSYDDDDDDDDDNDDDDSTTSLALVIALVCHTEIESVSSISVGTVFPNTMKSRFSQCCFYFQLKPNVSSVLFSCMW
jgi:uncharacterized protein YqhQ